MSITQWARFFRVLIALTISMSRDACITLTTIVAATFCIVFATPQSGWTEGHPVFIVALFTILPRFAHTCRWEHLDRGLASFLEDVDLLIRGATMCIWIVALLDLTIGDLVSQHVLSILLRSNVAWAMILLGVEISIVHHCLKTGKLRNPFQ